MNKRTIKTQKLSLKYKINFWNSNKISKKLSKLSGTNEILTDDSKKTLFKRRLIATQKLKLFYININKKQFYKYLEKNRKTQNIWFNFLVALESRLDTVLYRSGLTSTFQEARQHINHKHVNINNKISSFSNIAIKQGNFISFKSLKTNTLKKENALEKFDLKSNLKSFENNNIQKINLKNDFIIQNKVYVKKNFLEQKNTLIEDHLLTKSSKDKAFLLHKKIPLEVNFLLNSSLYINHLLHYCSNEKLTRYDNEMKPIIEFMR